MSEVYKGQQLQLHRPVAVKVLHPFLADDEGFVARFQREARIVATLRHPNIVQVFDFDHNVELDLYYMVMEYINGPTLKSRLIQESLSQEYIAATCAAIADALDYAHVRGMIHRDIKPANIMFLEDDQPVLTDFGIAKMLTLSGLTASGAMVGTPAYMAPEVGTGKAGTTYSDIYALGVVLYQAVTGSLPFNSESPMGIVMQHINEPAPHPSLLAPTIPPALEAVILKAMEKDPAARFNRAGEMATALRQAMALDNPNGKITPVPMYKIPIKSVVLAPQEGKTITSPTNQSTPIIGIYAKADADELSASDAVPASDNTESVADDGAIADSHTPRQRIGPLKKMLWGWLLILGLGIAGGGLWFGINGGIPPILREYQTQVPSLTPVTVVNLPNPTGTPTPSQTPSPTATPNPPMTRFPTLTSTPLPEPCTPRGRVDQVKIEPDEIVGPGSSLIAYISLRNTGDCEWQTGTQFQFVSGALMEAPKVFPLNALLPDATSQIHMSFRAPQAFGTYTSVWQIRQPDATLLGNGVKIAIIVEDLPTATPLPLPTLPTIETAPIPLALTPPVLSTWQNVAGTFNWQGTILLQATGGKGSYRYYNGAVREEALIDGGKLTVTAQRCDPLPLDVWIISGAEVLHWQSKIAYPEPDMCN